MKKWDYLVLDSSDWTEVLRYGKEGWEMFAVGRTVYNDASYYFKRELEEGEWYFCKGKNCHHSSHQSTPTTATGEWEEEFDKRFGEAYVGDGDSGYFVGHYLIEFIKKLLLSERQRIADGVKAMKTNKLFHDRIINNVLEVIEGDK